jgi:peptide deformylase
MIIVETSRIPVVEDIKDVPLDNLASVFKVCLEMEEVCNKENGIGLSAVQVGVPWKLFIMRGNGTCPLVPAEKYGYFVNCEYEPVTEERVVSLEGCLSLRSQDGRLRSFQVERFKTIRLFGFILKANGSELKTEPFDCALDCLQGGIVAQHEIDHHHAVLISDIGKEMLVW